ADSAEVELVKVKAELSAAQKERDELHDKFNEMSTQKQFWVKCAKELESQLETAEAALSAANEKLSKPVVLPTDEIGEAASFMSAAEVIPVSIVIDLIKSAGFTVEGDADAE
ncbi:hypothetical protein H0I68_21775, partial [Yersinia kristensenii]|uniref:hypothetical protein n=1 Tax=Yersinia kristensenii TaxID=28152 RepID=UPI001C60888C